MDYDFDNMQELERERELLLKKCNSIRQKLAIETEPDYIFKYKTQIQELEATIREKEQKIQQGYNIFFPEGQTLLRKVVEKLDIEEKLGLIHLVNCGRENMSDAFWEAFEKHKDEAFQFYFIGACPTQMPPHFAERLIYELIIEELEDKMAAIFCKRKPDGRLKIFNFPFNKRNLEKSQDACHIFFSKTFQFSDQLRFEDFLKQEIPKMKYAYVTLIFEVYETDWKSFFQDYFEWFILQFRSIQGKTPKFLFFFVVYIDKLHRNDHASLKKVQIMKTVNALQDRFPGVTGLLPLDPVPITDIRTWMMKLGEKNPSKFDGIIKILGHNLKDDIAKKNFKENELLNMDIVSRLQELIYTIFGKP